MKYSKRDCGFADKRRCDSPDRNCFTYRAEISTITRGAAETLHTILEVEHSTGHDIDLDIPERRIRTPLSYPIRISNFIGARAKATTFALRHTSP